MLHIFASLLIFVHLLVKLLIVLTALESVCLQKLDNFTLIQGLVRAWGSRSQRPWLPQSRRHDPKLHLPVSLHPPSGILVSRAGSRTGHARLRLGLPLWTATPTIYFCEVDSWR